jgi:GNAT superfamily N-acetyltransferase
MPNDAVTIRPAAEHEVETLQQHLGRGFPAKHAARFALQAEGTATYLIAWCEGVPVGHVFVEWAGTRDEPLVSLLGPCPLLTDLFVEEELRSHGIGSRLLQEVERLARERGQPRIALGVATNNPRARALYERRGYRDAGFGEYTSRWLETDEQGQERWSEEQEICLVKLLLLPGGQASVD